MKAWKKMAALVLALGLTAGFAACGGNDGGSNNAGNNSSSESSTVDSSSDIVEESSSDVAEESSDVVSSDIVSGDVSDSAEESVSSDVSDSTEESDSSDVSDNTEDSVSSDVSDSAEESVSSDVSDSTEESVSSDASDSTEDSDSSDAGEIVGEEVSKEEFLAIREAAYAVDNLTIVRTTQDGSETIYAADGKVHIVGEGTEGYKGAVDGVYYEWTLEDGYWYYEEMEWEKECAFASGADLLDEVLYYCQVLTYWDFDAETGMHKIENFQSYTAYAMVSNGKIVKCRLEISETEWVEMEITYGNATVGELPPLE